MQDECGLIGELSVTVITPGLSLFVTPSPFFSHARRGQVLKRQMPKVELHDAGCPRGRVRFLVLELRVFLVHVRLAILPTIEAMPLVQISTA